jgi:hypothetical protein
MHFETTDNRKILTNTTIVKCGSASATSLSISFLLSALTVCGFLVASEQIAHWFVIPVLLCGVLTGWDAVNGLRGRMDLFDPATLIGLFGFHFFFLAPLLHVACDLWTVRYIEPPADWRDWLGGMAFVNAGGLLLYRVARQRAAAWGQNTSSTTIWRQERRRLLGGVGVGLLLSVALQAWVYARTGGISGFVDAFTASITAPPSQAGFTGMGGIFMLSETFPILVMICYATYVERTGIARSQPVILLVLFGFFVLKMLFGGLHGSRSNTIWALLWAAGIIHFWVRPLSRTFVFAGVCFLVTFMYFYGFYKNHGSDALSAFKESSSSAESDANWKEIVLGDLGRADVQAFILYRLSMRDRDYQYAWGRTYLASLSLFIPRAIWPDRPPLKVKEGTEALYGAGTYVEDEWWSSLVYGLGGETMLNFGPIAVPFAYLVFGLLVGRLQRFLWKLHHGDTRLLLYPFLLIICFMALQHDSDNLLFMFVKEGFVPGLIVLFGSRVLACSNEAHRRSPTTSLGEESLRTGSRFAEASHPLSCAPAHLIT